MKNLKHNLLILLLACCTASFSQNGQLKLEPYQFESKSGQKIEAEIGNFSVPENRAVKSSRNIDLYFVRFKSTNPNPSNPIVYLAGGPGGSGISTAKGDRFELFMALREIGDVIAFDQRGTGLSNSFPECSNPAEFPLSEPGVEEVYISKMSKAAKECISFWREEGVEIEGYNTVENANDLEDLRKVLGAEKIKLWGISYGSHLGFDFIKRFEKSTDKVVLVGLEGPDHTIKLPEYNQRYLEYLNAKIQMDPLAKKAYPNLLELMGDVFSNLEQEPVYSEFTDRRSGKTLEVGISKLDVQLMTSFFLTKNPENSVKLPYLFQQMKEGNYSEVAPMIAGLKMYAGRLKGMPLIMDAMSGVSPKRWEKINDQSKSSLLGRTTNFPFPDLGVDLGLPDLGPEFRKNPVSSVPSLFFSGTLDGRTYIESAKELVKGFSNASHVIIDGAGHDMFMSTPKVKEMMLEFFQGVDVPSQTIGIKIPNFVVSSPTK